jgi:hypothetical protein
MSAKAKLSSAEFAQKLTNIFEERLSQLPPKEQDKKIAAFEKKAAKIYRENRSKVSTPSHTHPVLARSHE